MLMCLPTFGFAQLTSFVNPFVGTGGHGHTFPGATLPFGMMQLSPDTRVDGSWDGCSGYHYSDSLIYGFSHTHLSGTGVSDYGDVLLMPGVGQQTLDPSKYRSRFEHKDEEASPGYYKVLLPEHGIKAEFTVTERCGFHRYDFPSTKKAHIVLDLRHRDDLIDADLKVVSKTRIEGYRISKAWAKEQYVYFVMEFSQPFKAGVSQKVGFGNVKTANKTVAQVFGFDARSNQRVEVRVGISFTGIEGARKNLDAELPKKLTFELVRNKAQRVWEGALGEIKVFTQDKDKKTIFYTALYHTMMHPNVANDVDGKYRGHDHQIYKAEGHQQYTVFSLWDTFRAAHPLYNILFPEKSLDFVKSMLNIWKHAGRLPVWELASNETDCMIGYHSASVITDAYIKGIRDFDAKEALKAMVGRANSGMFGVAEFSTRGVIAIDDEPESVSKTLEYAYDDWCIAELAGNLGEFGIRETYLLRSEQWKNVLDPQSGFMRPRKNGGWLNPFDPYEVNNHYTEANSWQYSFFVPHNVYGLMRAHGGKEQLASRLNMLFNAEERTSGRTQDDMTGFIGQYVHGNEPSHHIAYLYNYVSKPQETQRRVRQILLNFYKNDPDGLIGNEDCGQMSAWYVFSSMGFYPTCPGSPAYQIGAPLFDSIHISLPNRKMFRIIANNQRDDNAFADCPMLDDKIAGNQIYHYQLDEASTLVFNMQPQPSSPCGYEIEAETVVGVELVPIPWFDAPSQLFVDSMEVRVHAARTDDRVEVLVAEKSRMAWEQLKGPLWIKRTQTIEARSVDPIGKTSHIVSAQYFKKPNNWKVKLNTRYNPQYSAGGPEGLIDGIRGSENWRKGDWQGYQEQDFEVIIDLGDEKQIREVSVGFLQDVRSWIWFPTAVEFSFSKDNQTFSVPISVAHNVSDKDYNVQVFEMGVVLDVKTHTRFIKIIARNYGIIPNWHPGRGNDAFIFVDEVRVE